MVGVRLIPSGLCRGRWLRAQGQAFPDFLGLVLKSYRHSQAVTAGKDLHHGNDENNDIFR